MEEDGGLEVLPVAVAASSVLDPLDLAVRALGQGVGDAVFVVGQYASCEPLFAICASEVRCQTTRKT